MVYQKSYNEQNYLLKAFRNKGDNRSEMKSNFEHTYSGKGIKDCIYKGLWIVIKKDRGFPKKIVVYVYTATSTMPEGTKKISALCEELSD